MTHQMTHTERVARAIEKHFAERFGASVLDGPSPSIAVTVGDYVFRFNSHNVATAALTAIDEERDALREALLPFAVIGNHCEGEPDETVLYVHQGLMGDYPLTIGDFRKARSLSSVSKEEK